MTSKHIETTLIGAGRGKRYTQGSVNPVTQRASSLVFDSARRASCNSCAASEQAGKAVPMMPPPMRWGLRSCS